MGELTTFARNIVQMPNKDFIVHIPSATLSSVGTEPTALGTASGSGSLTCSDLTNGELDQKKIQFIQVAF